MQNISGVIGLSILQNKKNKIFLFYDDHNNVKYCGDKFYISDLFSDLLKNEKFSKDIISNHNFICNSTVIIHRKLIEKSGKILPEKFEDWMYWIRALEHTPYCLYIDKPLVFYTTDNKKFYS
jgi:hypothetical protein